MREGVLSWICPTSKALPRPALAEHPWPVAGEAPLTPTEEASLPLAVTKEAKVSTLPEELPEDQLGEDELAALETA